MEEVSLPREASLDTILRLALANNPDLLEVRARASASSERVRSSGRLPDLEFKYEQWGVPLARPYALGNADTLMFGLRQSFPALGSLDARGRAAAAQAQISVEAQEAKILDLITQVRRAYFEYVRTETEYRLHLEHVQIAARVVELARSNYKAGRGTQQDVLRTIIELSKLHNDLATLEQQRSTVKALLNSLMARPPDAPLGAPKAPSRSEKRVDVQELERKLLSSGPQLAAAAQAVKASEAMLDAARRAANWPAFMVGADYWYMPTMASPHAYGAMIAVSLPWLNSRHREEVREAEHLLTAERRGLESVRNRSLYELRAAISRYEAAQESVAIFERDLLAQARQSYEAAQGAFAAGKADALSLLDALRSLFQVQLEHNRAIVRLESSYVDVEHAAGVAKADKLSFPERSVAP